jgi:hypothetical protein
MAAQEVDELIQRLFTQDHVDINGLSDETKMFEIAQALVAENVQVVVLTLHSFSGQLSIRAANALQNSFRENKSLRELQISERCDYLPIVLEGVALSKSIRTLALFDCNLCIQDIQALSNLEKLAFYNCRFENEAAFTLARALEPAGRLHSVRQLALDRCGLDKAKATEIAQGIRFNTSLDELELNWNPNIGGEGAAALANALSDNKTLTRLSLCGIRIGDEGAIALASWIKRSNKIEEIYLQVNSNLTNKGKSALLSALALNLSLVLLDIDCTTDDQQHIDNNRVINLFRRRYLNRDRTTTIAPDIYPHVFARVSSKPSALFFFLQERRGMFIPHLPDPSGLW